jgi:hypothetical protein
MEQSQSPVQTLKEYVKGEETRNNKINEKDNYLNTQSQLNSLLNPSKSSINLSDMDQKNTNKIIPVPVSSPFNQPSNDDEMSNQSDNEDNDEDMDNEDNEDNNSINNQNPERLPPRKRSKVSRACDECRRKKIRCDAVLDNATNEVTKICTNCEKTNESCTFTRVPLKRGPNKGYNKKSSVNSSPSANKRKQSRSRTNSATSNKFKNESDNDSTRYLPFQSSSVQRQQVVLPPLASIPFSNKQTDTNAISTTNTITNNTGPNQQGIFWKVPTDMPMLSNDMIPKHTRKGSVDSTHSSISSASSISSVNNRMLLSNSNYGRNTTGSISGIETSDSEDDFFMNNSRISRLNLQVPFTLQNRSPRPSFASDTDRRSSIGSIISRQNSTNFSPYNNTNNDQANQQMQSFPPLQQIQQIQQIQQPQQTHQNSFKPKIFENKESLYALLDNYYLTLYPQYPLLPTSEIIKSSLSSIIDNNDFSSILDLFLISLQSIQLNNSNLKLSDTNTTNNVNVKFLDIAKAFEVATSMFLSKSFIYSSIPAKIILTSTLTLLNYEIVLSGYDYSLGFGIAFSYFKDWLVFKEGYDSPCFANLIHLVILDSLHTLYYGVPRSSTVCFAIDSNFIDTFLREIKFPKNVELEWLSIGLHLVVLNNNLQELDTLDKLDTIVITGTNFKFMQIIKLYYELFIYCRKLNVQSIINDFNNNNNNNNDDKNPNLSITLNDLINNYINNIELDISKITKKITNLIDEQLDDLELTKPNVLISLILIKCIRISINLEIFIKSIIYLNDVLDLTNNSNIGNKSSFNPESNDRNNNSNRNRSNSENSINSNSNFTDYNNRLLKIVNNVESNIKRCINLNQIHQHCKELMQQLNNSKKHEILVPRTNNSGGIEYSVVIQNWIRLVNTFFAGEITKEGINGWCYV